MEPTLIVLLFVALALFLYLFVDGILNAKNPRDLGLVLIVFGLFFGWPFSAIGGVLVAVHYLKED